MGYWIVNGKQMTDAEYREHQRQEAEAKQRVQREAASLVKKLGETYEALTSLMQQHPEVDREVTDNGALDEKIYEKLRRNLELADEAPRCRWVRQDGTGCGSPQMRKHIYCFAHKQMMEARALALRLPPPEDANAIQMSLTQVQKALIDGKISAKTAGLLLYSLQLAMTNVGQTTFGQAADDEMVTEIVDEEEALREEALSTQQSAISQNKESFTAKDAQPPQQAKTGLAGDPGRAKEEKALPLIHTDEEALSEKAFSTQQSALSQRQGLCTAKDAEDAKKSGGLQRIEQNQLQRIGGEESLPLIHTDEEALSEKALSTQRSAISQNKESFTAKDAQPPQQAKTGLAGDPGRAKEEKALPLIRTDEEALSSRQSAVSQRQSLCTAKDAEDAKKSGGLQRIEQDQLQRIGEENSRVVAMRM